MGSFRFTGRVNHAHVRATVLARLLDEGFIHDTEHRRRLVDMRAGPKPEGFLDIEQDGEPCTH
jgi:hypothetical protein